MKRFLPPKMRTAVSLQPGQRILTVGIVLLGLSLLAQPTSAQLEPEAHPVRPEFVEAVPQGFGDRQNSIAWSMVWWKGKLYVGTGRSTQCVHHATGHLYYPIIMSYPPLDPDIECTPDARDLRLQAEIWRWTPQTDAWERIFQSPNDVPIPGAPGKYVARDIGFRSMVVFKEPGGTEALYVGGVSSNTFNLGVPPARILRSTDGVTFEPLPQAPGTFLGDLAVTSFRSMVVYKEKLYVIASVGFAGFGPVLEADSPAQGNDSFRLALPKDITAFELETYNGYLYIGTGTNPFAFEDTLPFSVLKIDANGAPPYTPVTVIAQGGFRPFRASRSVVSLHVFKGRLYVGTDQPAELLRINADDTWDLIVGTPRQTPEGVKHPLSGMDVGFDNPLNIHVWRMQSHNGHLFVGTMDQSTKWRTIPLLKRWLNPTLGFDLYTTANGEDFVMVTRTGFGDMFDVGVRSFASTPHGLVFGTANHYYGTRVWRERSMAINTAEGLFAIYLPLVWVNAAGGEALTAPEGLQVETSPGGAVLSWQQASPAARYRIFRADFVSNRVAYIPDVEPEAWIPGPFLEIGATDQPYFVDGAARPEAVYHYYVLAESAAGIVSTSSTLARFPSLRQP